MKMKVLATCVAGAIAAAGMVQAGFAAAGNDSSADHASIGNLEFMSESDQHALVGGFWGSSGECQAEGVSCNVVPDCSGGVGSSCDSCVDSGVACKIVLSIPGPDGCGNTTNRPCNGQTGGTCETVPGGVGVLCIGGTGDCSSSPFCVD